MKYEKVAVGGTFDYLHDGHKAIISKAFEVGQNVQIGIVSDKMELEKDSAGIQSLEKRCEKLKDFLKERNWLDRAEFKKLNDRLGPAVDDEDLEAIVVSAETRPNANRINDLRSERQLTPIEIVQIPFVLADDGKPISSIRIRYGEIDIHGNVMKEEKRVTDYG